MTKPLWLPRLQPLGIGLLLAFTIWQWGQAATIYVKAHLAKALIATAWQQTVATGTDRKPWPWADTWPVAQIQLPDNQHYLVLAGSAGNSLAFGPGHVSTTPLPGTGGASVIGGHRDTHFTGLQQLQQGDKIRVQNKKGQWQLFTVDSSWVADSDTQPLLIDQSINQLYLVTCYPFNSLVPNGSQRFIVRAIADS